MSRSATLPTAIVLIFYIYFLLSSSLFTFAMQKILVPYLFIIIYFFYLEGQGIKKKKKFSTNYRYLYWYIATLQFFHFSSFWGGTNKMNNNYLQIIPTYVFPDIWENFLNIFSSNLGVLVAHDCNSAIGGQGQSGCMWTVCHGSLSELRISVRTKLNDVDTHS